MKIKRGDIVAMITSNMARAGPNFRVPMLMQSPATRGTGLKSDSVIMLDNLTTIVDRHIHRRIGQLTDASAVNAALRIALAL